MLSKPSGDWKDYFLLDNVHLLRNTYCGLLIISPCSKRSLIPQNCRGHPLEIRIRALRNSAKEDAAAILGWPQNALLKR